MSFLEYKSDEMVSSTHLIRKSKSVFDSLAQNEIEKAVILRDGKPSFLLMDFAKYEEVMKEYLFFKEFYESAQKEEVVQEKKIEPAKTAKEENTITSNQKLQNALNKIEAIEKEEPNGPLKEFWE